MSGLTASQSECLAFIQDTMAVSKIGPSFDEIKAALGLSSKSGVHLQEDEETEAEQAHEEVRFFREGLSPKIWRSFLEGEHELFRNLERTWDISRGTM